MKKKKKKMHIKLNYKAFSSLKRTIHTIHRQINKVIPYFKLKEITKIVQKCQKPKNAAVTRRNSDRSATYELNMQILKLKFCQTLQKLLEVPQEE